jgi:hypothetical protein
MVSLIRGMLLYPDILLYMGALPCGTLCGNKMKVYRTPGEDESKLKPRINVTFALVNRGYRYDPGNRDCYRLGSERYPNNQVSP